MPLELGVWRIDGAISAVSHQTMDTELRLEELIHQDVSVVAPHLMIIGRQVFTSFGKVIDILAVDANGGITVIELKRDQTPREVVAQVLDYGSWVQSLRNDDIAEIWQNYLNKYRSSEAGLSLDQAFMRRFNLRNMPDELNESHELLIIAGALDESTERIVNYLADYHKVNINAVFFRMFKDGDREYLTRAWLRDPVGSLEERSDDNGQVSWNGEYYVSFAGEQHNWEEAVRYGFIAAGGGAWYTNSLNALSPGDRVWVNVPGVGYVGVGRVTKSRMPIEAFLVEVPGEGMKPIHTLPLKISQGILPGQNPEKGEYLVGVSWEKWVPIEAAIREKGFFGNQNTVAKPTTPKWDHTISRLKMRFGVL